MDNVTAEKCELGHMKYNQQRKCNDIKGNIVNGFVLVATIHQQRNNTINEMVVFFGH